MLSSSIVGMEIYECLKIVGLYSGCRRNILNAIMWMENIGDIIVYNKIDITKYRKTAEW